jgi:hypothetical protein
VPPAILNQGKTALRDSDKALLTHLAVSDDAAAFGAGQTVVNPTGGATTVLTKAATRTNSGVANDQFDSTISIDGSTEFTNKSIMTIATAKGSGTTGAGTDTVSRSVRGAGLGIGVQPGDNYTIGARVKEEDNS